MLGKDISRVYRDGSGGRVVRTINVFRSPGLHAVIVYRLGHWLIGRNILVKLLLGPIYVLLSWLVRVQWGIQISRRATIGEGLKIQHFGLVIVSSDAVLGRNVSLAHDVTIGSGGSGEKSGVPVVGDNVYIAPGARLFGKIRIGDNVKIGANAVVYKDIPDNAVVAAAPGFAILSYKGNRRDDSDE